MSRTTLRRIVSNATDQVEKFVNDTMKTTRNIAIKKTDIASNATLNFMEWAGRVLKINKLPLAVFVTILLCIALLILIILIFYLCYCCCCRTKRNKGVQMTKVATLYKDQLPGLDNDGGEKSCGNLEYSLEYNMKVHELKVKLIQCTDLVTPLGCGTTDPYVKISLTTKGPPDSKPSKLKPKVYVTGTKMDTKNPSFNESVSFKLAYEDLKYTSIKMIVYDYDEIAQHLVIGGYTVELKSVLLEDYVGKNYETTVNLNSDFGAQEETGQLCIVLTNSVRDSELHVNVLEAKNLNLPIINNNHYPDTFVSVTLHIGKKKLGNKKTQVRKNTANPYFGETLVFSVNKNRLAISDLTCKIKYKSAVGIIRTHASVHIGCTASSASGQKQWREILTNPKRPVGMWQAVVEHSDD